jgi:KDO2-lipid IV(A) lauroyltransferase
VKKTIRQLYFLGAWLFAKLVLLMPYPVAVQAGGGLGFLAYYLVADARRETRRNLRSAFPEKNEKEIRKIARLVFVNQGKNLFELFSFPKLTAADFKELVTIEKKERLEQALLQGKGVLIASAHCGNWEIMCASIALAGIPLNVIARRIYIEGLNTMLVNLRMSKGARVILRSGRDAARNMLRSLRHGECLGMLIDQDTDVPGVFVDFFGRTAWTPSGLASLAVRTGAPVVMALDVRMPDERHTVQLSEPLSMISTDDREHDVRVNTQRITALIEEHIRRNPSQWVWMHRRWKTRPQTGQGA